MPDASKNEIKPWLKQQWVIPPKTGAAFVAPMEDVLDTYEKPYDPSRPVVCVDEGGKQLIGEVREPLPVRLGSPMKQDSEYRRNGMANLFMAFEPAEAHRLTQRFEWHYTPRHGSWLNVAEMERSVLARQCLGRRTPDRDALNREVTARERNRNRAVVKVNWQFTTEDARLKLRKLYPTIELQ